MLMLTVENKNYNINDKTNIMTTVAVLEVITITIKTKSITTTIKIKTMHTYTPPCIETTKKCFLICKYC